MDDKNPNYQDDELESGSSEGSQEESDDFGLPEASTNSDLEYGEDSDLNQGSDDSDSDIFNDDISEDEEIDDSHEYKYEETQVDERRRNPIGLIISFILIGVIVVAIAIYWFFFREPAREQIVEQPVVEEVVEPPVIEETTSQDSESENLVIDEELAESTETSFGGEEGAYETINARTGRYFIVLNSFFDGDLAEDYAKSLAKDGFDTKIISPVEAKKGFHRVVLSNDYGTWHAADANVGELKGVFGETIWVLKY